MRLASPPFAVAIVLSCSSLSALDKQGSAHSGNIGGESEGTHVSGSVMVGSALYNPTYAARPDNSGHALFRYAARADIDLIGSRLSIPIDVNTFTDRDQPGIGVMKPTELDLIAGVTSTWPLGPGAIEIGSRVEHDRPIDQGTFTQTYLDLRSRYLYSLARSWPDLARYALDVTGWVTLGAFVLNPTYAARPDNSGKALLRYALHTELSILDDLVSVGVDGTMFTDRQSAVFVPSELDLTPEIILHLAPFELHVAYESDLPIDRSGLTQTYVYALGAWNFDFHREPVPLEPRGQLPSP
ncbi:MAG TPA: hypothetical protein VK550_04425 [Polyangiaceae bacterium]|nr:hypothetical protein [Polyangiaceae bacterium]